MTFRHPVPERTKKEFAFRKLFRRTLRVLLGCGNSLRRNAKGISSGTQGFFRDQEKLTVFGRKECENRLSNPLVMIKSYPHGIALHLDADAPFSDILEELKDKMKEAAGFFQGARLALSIEDRKVSPQEERQLIQALALYGGPDIFCVAERSGRGDDFYVHALQKAEPRAAEEPYLLHKGSLTDGEVLENSKKTIIVIGDIGEDCRVISARNIIVLGGLYGEAYAGTDSNENHYVAALSMETDGITIAGCKAAEQKGKWFSRTKKQPQIAVVRNHEVIKETITKEYLNDSGLELF